MTDIDERAEAAWRDETTARERVKQVLEQTVESATAATIAERALTSEPTARKYCEALVEEGVGVAERDGRATRYRRDEGHLVDERIAELRVSRSHDELLDGIRRMKREIADYRDEHGVEDPEELALALAPGDEGWRDVEAWRATQRNLAIAQAALRVDEAHRAVEA